MILIQVAKVALYNTNPQATSYKCAGPWGGMFVVPSIEPLVSGTKLPFLD